MLNGVSCLFSACSDVVSVHLSSEAMARNQSVSFANRTCIRNHQQCKVCCSVVLKEEYLICEKKVMTLNNVAVGGLEISNI